METPEKESNEEGNNTEIEDSLIPFMHRKSLLLSISFRALNLEMSEFKMKIESFKEDELKEPLITDLCETTMVIINFNIYLSINYRFLNFN
jgi:hypothetical protein